MRTPIKPKEKPKKKATVEEEKQTHDDKLGKSQKEASTVSEEEHLHLIKRKVLKRNEESHAGPHPVKEILAEPEPVMIQAKKEPSLEENLGEKSVKEARIKKPTRKNLTSKAVNQ